MNIAFVNSTRRWGGVKNWTLGLAPRLVARGHQVRLHLRAGDPFAEACRRHGLEVEEIRFGPDWNPLAMRRLRSAFRAHATDVVVTNVSKDNRIAGPVARGLGLPVVNYVGGTGDLRDRLRVRWEYRRYVDQVIVPAYAVRDRLAEFPWMRAGERVTVIHNGIDVERFRPGPGIGRLREILGVSYNQPVLLTTGQLTSVKGHDVLLRALARLDGVRPAPVLAMTSVGPEEPRLRELAAELGLADRVRFLGFVDELETMIEDADVCVQPSLEEGLPLSVVEFMAKGKPVVASAVAGIPELIEDGVDGLLVPARDVDRLTGALERLLFDASLRSRLGEAARTKAVGGFGLETMTARVEHLLTTVAAG